jgi:hypothetical protein
MRSYGTKQASVDYPTTQYACWDRDALPMEFSVLNPTKHSAHLDFAVLASGFPALRLFFRNRTSKLACTSDQSSLPFLPYTNMAFEGVTD